MVKFTRPGRLIAQTSYLGRFKPLKMFGKSSKKIVKVYRRILDLAHCVQMEVGTEPDFLLLVKNNLQDATVAKPSKMAGKYMAFGQGELSNCFFSSGIKFDANKMYKLANNFNYAEEETVDTNETENQESTNHTKGYQPKTAQNPQVFCQS